MFSIECSIQLYIFESQSESHTHTHTPTNKHIVPFTTRIIDFSTGLPTYLAITLDD